MSGARMSRLCAAVLVLALFAAACGGTTGSTSTAGTTTSVPSTLAFDADAATTTTPELTAVAVAARNSLESSPLWVADAQGLFAKYGIDVRYVPVPDEGAVVGALLSDEARVGVLSSTAMVSGVRSIREDLFEPLVYIAGTDIRAESGRATISLIAPSDSAIRTGCDLEGKIVSVDGLRTATSIAVREMILRDGCDPSQVSLVVQGADETVSTLRSKEIDAAATLDPLTARVLRGPNVVVANLDAQLCPEYGVCPLSIAVIDSDWAEINPELAQGFRRAMNEAISWIRVNEIEYRAELVSCCSMDVDDASQSVVPNFVGDRRDLISDMDRLQEVVANQLELGRLADEASADETSAPADTEPDDAETTAETDSE